MFGFGINKHVDDNLFEIIHTVPASVDISPARDMTKILQIDPREICYLNSMQDSINVLFLIYSESTSHSFRRLCIMNDRSAECWGFKSIFIVLLDISFEYITIFNRLLIF